MRSLSTQPRLVSRLAFVAALAVPAAHALEVPPLEGRINDLAGMISDGSEQRLEGYLAELEQETGSQVAVLTVPSLEGEVLEDYSLRVAEAWRLGRGQFDDGALLLIAREERRMRLEVGYGLEGTIPDAYAKRIVDDVIRPRFKSGDFDGGVIMAVDAIGGLIRGDDSLPPPAAESTGLGSESRGTGILGFLFFLIPLGLFSLQALASRGCASWMLYLFMMPFWLFFPLAVLGTPFGFIPVVLWIVGFPILRAILQSTGFGTSGGRGGMLWGPTGGWSSSRGGWGGSFGGGGFSGGGGSFGGGGASGSW